VKIGQVHPEIPLLREIIKKLKQEAFEKCWAHSPLRAAACPFTRCRLRIDVHDDAGQRRRQRQRVTEGTAMAPWNGPKERN